MIRICCLPLGLLLLISHPSHGKEIPAQSAYLEPIVKAARVDWPRNRTINIACHGHSVPSGYFRTPEVHTFESYPHLMHLGLAAKFPHAVINVIVTGIGGENAEGGAKRFEHDVLSLRPELITIDYALNDRKIGLERARKAWVSMIEAAKAKNIKVILLTPTADLGAKLDDPQDPLNQHAEQIRSLAKEYEVGLADSLAAFKTAVKSGQELRGLMSSGNHPNKSGHALVAAALLEWFPVP